MAFFRPSTWRLLGLGVAATYTGLGLFEMLLPRKAGQLLLAIEPRTTGDEAGKNGDDDGAGSWTDGSDMASLLVPLCGARDLTIAAALFTYWQKGRDWEMGVLIASGVILGAVDSAALWARKGASWGVAFVAGMTVWTGIGLGLMSY